MTPGKAGTAMGALHWLRAAWRLARVACHVACGLATVLVLFPWLGRRAREACIGRWSRGIFRALGIEWRSHGQPHAGARLIVANHVSWLDIMAIHASCPEARFVAMAEVQQWPLVPLLVRSARTIFLQRRRLRDLRRAVHDAATALRAGDTVAVFPEGVVSDGQGTARFHGNLLQAAIDAAVPVQAVALCYIDACSADAGRASDAPLFTGNITLAQSLWRLACADALVLHVHALPTRAAPHTQHRRAIAGGLQAEVGQALHALLPRPVSRPALAPPSSPPSSAPAPGASVVTLA
jgi:1-acyl-sn-glycerol-3-phosphate acyltransferase